jgi:hypothetical protein
MSYLPGGLDADRRPGRHWNPGILDRLCNYPRDLLFISLYRSSSGTIHSACTQDVEARDALRGRLSLHSPIRPAMLPSLTTDQINDFNCSMIKATQNGCGGAICDLGRTNLCR